MIRLAILVLLLGLAACAPRAVSRDRALAECRRAAPLADGFAGTVGVGAGSRGAAGKAGVTVTNRIVNPQSEADFIADCIARKTSGQPEPTTFGVTVSGNL